MLDELTVEKSFWACHKNTGDKKHHSHEYIAEWTCTFVSLPDDAADTMENLLGAAIIPLDGANLNELFKGDSRCSFLAPSLVNVARYLRMRLTNILIPAPISSYVIVTEIDSSDRSQSAVKMVA